MSIARKIQKVNIQEAFFPVEERPIGMSNGLWGFQPIKGYKAIVDPEDNHAFSVVSDNYRLIRNEEAFDMVKRILPILFPEKTIGDFEVFNIKMPKTKGSCIIDLIIPTTRMTAFGMSNEVYTPFIRVVNSYNRTSNLKFELGFCRWICLNGVIFGEIGFKFTASHTSHKLDYSIEQIVEAGINNMIDVRKAWEVFEAKLKAVKEISMPQSLILAMYCKAFNVIIDPKKVSPHMKEVYSERVKKLIEDGKEYFTELGNNGYAMFNVLTDYASYPVAGNSFGNAYQVRVTEWLDKIVEASKAPDFKLSDFVKDYLDTSYYLESLVQN